MRKPAGGPTDGLAHDGGSPAWKPQATLTEDSFEEGGVVAHRPYAKRLTGVGVEVDAHQRAKEGIANAMPFHLSPGPAPQHNLTAPLP